MTIILQSENGGIELEAAEADENIRHLRDGDTQIVPKGRTSSLLIDPDDPNSGWHDMTGNLHVDEDDPNHPKFAAYKGTRIKVRQFLPTTTEGLIEFHIPHDYMMGTPIYVHVHWSHDSALVTSGSLTWGFEFTYAKGHNQAAFGSVATIAIIEAASLTPYQHMIAETIASSVGGSATTLDTDLIEVDGVISGAVYLDSNDIVVSGGAVPNPFVHFHYQSTGRPTKQKSPDFWT